MSMPDDKLAPLERTGVVWFLSFMIVIGAVFVAVGFSTWGADYKEMLVTAGSAVFGSALGSCFGLLTGQRLHKDVNNVQHTLDRLIDRHEENISELCNSITTTLSASLKTPWSTDEKILQHHRTTLYQYHRTRDADGEFWSCRKIDFSKHKTPGKLYCEVIIEKDGRPYSYDHEGFIIDNRLIILTKSRLHGEDIAIAVYHDYGKSLHTKAGYSGIYLHNDWNSVDGYDPCIITHEHIFNIASEGRLPQYLYEKLHEHWIRLSPPAGMHTT